MKNSVYLPREDLVRDVVRDVRKERSVLLAGPEGVGKTFVVEEVLADLEVRGHEVVYLASGRAFKQVVLGVAEVLHGLGELEVPGIDLEGSWEKVSGRLARPAVDKIAPAVLECLEGVDLVLALDNFDAPWPRYAAYFKAILSSCVVVAASEKAHTSKMAAYKPYFRVVDVPRLSEEESGELAEQLYEFHGVNSPDREAFVRKASLLADGFPQRLHMIFEDAAKEGVVTREYVRSLEEEGPKQFVNMGWLFMAGACSKSPSTSPSRRSSWYSGRR